MYIREVIKIVQKKRYVQHHLIESFRTVSGPRQRVILNLGVLPLPREEWKALANAIEGKLKRQEDLFTENQTQDLQRLASHYVNLIIKTQKSRTEEVIETGTTTNEALFPETKPKTQYETIDINSIEYSQSRTIGAEQVLLEQMKEYGFDKLCHELGFSELQKQYAQILIAGRAIHPASERETARWTEENSGIKELIGLDAKVHDNGLHRMAVSLLENQESIENYLAEKAKERFGLEESIILYDLTNTYFEGRQTGSEIAKHGRSKEKRSDCPIVTLALRVDAQGFPKKSQIYEGNVSEPETLEKILNELSDEKPRDELENLWGNNNKTIVIDAGIATKENLELITNKKFKYLAISRDKKYPKEYWENAEEKNIFLANKESVLRVKLHRTETENFLLCHSEEKKAKESAIINRRIEKFETELKDLDESLKKKRSRKKYEYILEKIGRLKERYAVGNLYDIQVEKTSTKKNKKGESSEIATKIIYKQNKHGEVRKANIGKYVIRTNRLNLDEEAISQIHRSLTQIEKSFRSMKSELGMRPNYHKNDTTIKAHIFITVLAYHLMAGIQKKLTDQGAHHEWNTIRNILESHTRVTSSFKNQEGEVIYHRDTTQPNLKQSEIYNKLKISHSPLKPEIIKISPKQKLM